VPLHPKPGLHAVDDVSGPRPYKVFTPYYRAWLELPRREVLPAPARLPPLPAPLDMGALPSLGALGLTSPLQAPPGGGEAEACARAARFLDRRDCGVTAGQPRPGRRPGTPRARPAAPAATVIPTRTQGGSTDMRSDIAPGATFPDYELPDHESVSRKLSEIQGDDPMILTLARGHYCPKEHQQHLELAAHYPKIAVAYTRIATISTDEHHTSQEFRSSVGAQWPFLEDPGRIVQKDLDIQEYTDPDNDPMIPHTLVLKPGLVVHRIYNGYWFWGRPSFYDLWRDLREISSEIRPDWDLGAPGLREAWEAGDYSRFHGWDRKAGARSTAA
jgi:peroxiredoxin